MGYPGTTKAIASLGAPTPLTHPGRMQLPQAAACLLLTRACRFTINPSTPPPQYAPGERRRRGWGVGVGAPGAWRPPLPPRPHRAVRCLSKTQPPPWDAQSPVFPLRFPLVPWPRLSVVCTHTYTHACTGIDQRGQTARPQPEKHAYAQV